jgi:nucleoside-diphosphate-sugar epimerase
VNEGLTVAVTGPTGDIGRAAVRALEQAPEVGRVVGMARRPFDPSDLGWERAEYRQGDVLDRDSVDALVQGADVVVHLAFIIFGDREETREINLEGSRNVFEAAVAAGASRLVYTSSVAAYGFHDDNPQPLTEDVEPRGTEGFYYSAQKAELEGLLEDLTRGKNIETYVLRPCIVAGPDATTLVDEVVDMMSLNGVLEPFQRMLQSLPVVAPVLPDPGVPFQLVHHDDVATAVRAAALGRGAPGVYNLAAEETLTTSDIARSLGWRSLPVPSLAVDAATSVLTNAPLMPARAGWANAFSVPVVMDTARARDELGWVPEHGSQATLTETVDAARAAGTVQ